MLEIHLTDPETEDLLRSSVNSFAKLDIVMLLGRNGLRRIALDEIACYTGRKAAEVTAALEELREAGLVDTFEVEEGMVVFALKSGGESERLVEHLLRLFENTTERLKIISILIQESEQAPESPGQDSALAP